MRPAACARAPIRRGRASSHALAVALALLASAAAAHAQTYASDAERRTAEHFAQIRDNTPMAYLFLRGMPKGADLHHHLSGSVYAESYVAWAAAEGMCVDGTATLTRPPCDPAAGQMPASNALTDASARNRVIDAMSMRNWNPARATTGEEQFFASFNRFRAISGLAHTGAMLAEVAARAAANHVSYIETMLTPDGGGATSLGRQVGYDPDLERMRTRLLAAGLRDTLARASRTLADAFARQRERLGCATQRRDPGCDVVVRILYQVARARTPELVFAQILAGFEMATRDSLVVGFNLVQPEDHPVALRDYSLHMRMIAHLRPHYPDVPVTLHAGELTMGLVPPEELRFHIREAVRIAGAARIGHGVDIAFEDSAAALLAEMARRPVLVEVAPSSNEMILGITGEEHPIRLYLRHGVPVALVTDDEGVARSEMTWEWVKAAQAFRLTYPELKAMARRSIEHSFAAPERKAALLQRLDAGLRAFEGRY